MKLTCLIPLLATISAVKLTASQELADLYEGTQPDNYAQLNQTSDTNDVKADEAEIWKLLRAKFAKEMVKPAASENAGK